MDIIPSIDGGSIFTGSIQDPTTLENNVLLVKLNNHGDTVWTKIHGYEFSSIGSAICKTNDNGFIIVGATIADFGDGEHNYPLLIKTDYNGNTSCSGFSNMVVTNATFIEETLSLQVLNGGYFKHLSDCETENLNLTDTLLCAFYQDVEPYNTKSGISCYPNPFSESTSILIENPFTNIYTLNLFNATGKLVHQSVLSNSNTITLQRNGLPIGIYLLVIKDNAKTIGQAKIVIQ